MIMKSAILSILLTGFFFTVQAQTKGEQQLLQAVEKLRQAMISGNRTDLENIVSKKLNYGHSGGKVEDYTTFIETIVSGKSDFVTADFNKQSVQLSGKIALVRHQLDAKTNDGGKPGEIHLGILLVWKKEAKAWKLLARQAYKLPQ